MDADVIVRHSLYVDYFKMLTVLWCFWWSTSFCLSRRVIGMSIDIFLLLWTDCLLEVLTITALVFCSSNSSVSILRCSELEESERFGLIPTSLTAPKELVDDLF